MFISLLRKIVFLGLLCMSHVILITADKSCNGTAKYTLTFKAEWTSQSHKDFPSGAHFSPLVGCSHNASYVMWTPASPPGMNATAGVKDVAERGRTTALNNEMEQQITLKAAFKKYQGSGISGGTGTSSIANIEVNSEYSLVSFITMIAPSPDWFVGVHDFDLCDTTTGKWMESRSRDLPPYDAGTDSGTRFRSSNSVTKPPVNIHLLTNTIEGSLKGNESIRRFGTFTFVKMSANGTIPTDTAHPVTNLSASLVLILCVLNTIGCFF